MKDLRKRVSVVVTMNDSETDMDVTVTESGGYLVVPDTADTIDAGAARVSLRLRKSGIAGLLGASLGLESASVTLLEQHVVIGGLFAQPDRDRYAPGDTATLRVLTVDDAGRPRCDGILTTSTGELISTCDGTFGTHQVRAGETRDVLLTLSGAYAQTGSLRLPVTENLPPVRFARSGAIVLHGNATRTMTLVVEPRVTFTGRVTERLPSAARVLRTDPPAYDRTGDEIVWERRWEAGKRYALHYDVRASGTANAFLRFGPASADGDADSAIPSSGTGAASSATSATSATSVASATSAPSSPSAPSAPSSSGSSISSATSVTSATSAPSAPSVTSASSTTPVPSDTTPVTTSGSLSFTQRLLSRIHAMLIDTPGDNPRVVHVEEERTWHALLRTATDAADDNDGSSSSRSRSSAASSLRTNIAFDLRPSQDHFDAHERAVFTLTDEDLPLPGEHGDDVDTDSVEAALAERIMSDESVSQVIMETIAMEQAAVIAENVLSDSVAAQEVRQSLGNAAGSVKRDETLEQAVISAITEDAGLRRELAAVAAENESAKTAASRLATTTVKKEIAKAVAEERDIEETVRNATSSLGEAADAVRQAIVEQERAKDVIVEAVTQPRAAEAAPTRAPVISVKLTDKNGRSFQPKYSFKKGSVLLVLEPERRFTPGIYTLEVTISDPLTGASTSYEQDFAWGVLAVNTDKDVYAPGNRARIAIGVLDDLGEIVCNADLRMEIAAPDGNMLTLSTDDGSIAASDTCGVKESMLVDPDYAALLTLPHEGTYRWTLVATTANGTRTHAGEIRVREDAGMRVRRTAATRLFPFGPSPMTLSITFERAYEGVVRDLLPEGFSVSNANGGTVTTNVALPDGSGTGTIISWNVNARAGETVTFDYVYDAPDISPEFYLVGPVLLDNDQREARRWQIANDAATIRYWDGGGGDNNWSTAANWTSDTVPGAADVAYFDGRSTKNATIDASFGGAVAELKVAPGYTGTITLGRIMHVYKKLVLSGGTLDVSASNYQLNVYGDWENYGGTFNEQFGSVLLRGTGSHVLREPGSFHNLRLYADQIGYWPFNEGTGTSTRESNAHLAQETLGSGVTWTTTVPDVSYYNPYALSFDGTANSYILLSNDSNYGLATYQTSISVGGWIKTTASNAVIFAGRNTADSGDTRPRIILTLGNDGSGNSSTGKPSFALQADNFFGPILARGNTAINDGTWHHVFGTRNGLDNSVVLYVDGSVAATATDNFTFAAASMIVNEARFGDDYFAGITSFVGQMDELHFYQRALKPAEVANLASGAKMSGPTYVLATDLDVNNYRSDGGTLDASASNHTITFGKSVREGGDINARTGTIQFSPSAIPMSISGSIAFHDLSVTTASTNTLFLDHLGHYTISGALTLNGAASNLLTVRSSQSGAHAGLQLDAETGTQDLGYLRAQDIDSSLGATLVCTSSLGCEDGGNNLNWEFTKAIWDGGGGNNNWSTAANWVGDNVPGSGDNVQFDGASSNKSVVIDVPVTIGDLTVFKNFTGSITISAATTVNGTLTHSGTNATGITWTQDEENDLVIGNNLLVYSGSVITVRRSSTTGNGSGQSIAVGGNMMIATGATVTAEGEGFGRLQGPGKGANNAAASHGGIGTNEQAPYGSFTDPTSLGSGGFSFSDVGRGGGAIVIRVGGTLSVQGRLSASVLGSGSSGGAGGSLNITAGSLVGAGTISAAGGGSGGGGRIAFHVSGTDSFNGTIDALGGGGTAGTIYLSASKRNYLLLGGTGMTTLTLGYDNQNSYSFGTIKIATGGSLIMDSYFKTSTDQGTAATLALTNLIIDAGGSLNADAKGFPKQEGPGYLSGSTGGSHGGQNSVQNTPTYGSITNPTTLGSGGNSSNSPRGGGAVLINASGQVTVNGSITSKAIVPGSQNELGAGGSINITAATIAGSGVVDAGAYNGAGGGRIAVKLTSGTSFGSIIFKANTVNAGAGTIYLEDASDGAGNGDLIINNRGSTTTVPTSLNGQFHSNTTARTVTVESGAYLEIGTGVTLTTSSNTTGITVRQNASLRNRGSMNVSGAPNPISNTATFVNDASSTITLTGVVADTAVTLPNLTYGNLTINNTGTTFNLSNNTTIRGNLTLTNGLLDATASNYNLTVGGSFIDVSAGNQFEPRNASVTFNGSGSINANEAFNDISFSPTGLVAYWNFDEGAGGTCNGGADVCNVWADRYHGTRYGAGGSNNLPQWTATKPTLSYANAYAMNFDGTDDYVSMGDMSVGEDKTFTYSLWMKSDNTANDSVIFSESGNDTYRIILSAGKIRFYIDGNDSVGNITDVVDGTFHHIAVVGDQSTLKLYVDGILNSTDNNFSATNVSLSNSTIGARLFNASPISFFTGLVDDVRIFSTNLSSRQIQQLSGGAQIPTYVIASDLDVNGSLTLSGGLLRVSGSQTIALSGSWIHDRGTFEPGTGTVSLDGGDQAIRGATGTTFYNLTKSVAEAHTLTFGTGGRVTILNDTQLQGTNVANRLNLRSTNTGHQWEINPSNSGTRTIEYVDVQDSNNLNASIVSCEVGCLNSGNNTNWTFPWTGTVYADAGQTPVGSGKLITVAVNGVATGSGRTNGSGKYTISLESDALDGDVMTIYLDGEDEQAVLVTRTNGQELSGMHLYADHLIVRNETGGALITAHLATADNVADDDVSDFYAVTGNDLTVFSGKTFLVWENSTFTPGGAVAVTDIDVDGTFAMGTNAVTVSGSWNSADGTVAGTNTVTFDAAGLQTITSSGTSFANLAFDGTGEWRVEDRLDVDDSLSIDAGTLDLNGKQLINTGGTFSNSGTLKINGDEILTGFTLDTDSGETLLSGTGSYDDIAGLSVFYHLTLSGAGTWQTNGDLDVRGTLLLTSGSLHSGTGTLTLRAGATESGGTLVSSGTILLRGTGDLSLTSSIEHLVVSGGTIRLGRALDVDGNLILRSGTLSNTGSHAINLAGTWERERGAFASGSGTVTLDGGNQTLSGSTTFWNLNKTATSAATLTFRAGDTHTIRGTWTARGAAGQVLSLRSSQNGTQWNINPQGTRSLQFIDVRDSNNVSGTTILCANDCVNSGNNSDWAFPMLVTVYSDTGSTAIGSGYTVAVAVNGAGVQTAQTNASGVATFTTVGTSPGDVLSMWLDDETPNGGVVTVTNGTSLEFSLYRNHLIVRHEYGASIANSHLAIADNVNDSDVDALYVMSGTQLSMRDGITLLVWTGSTYSPGGTVSAGDIDIDGTFEMGANPVTVGGSWDATGGSFSGTNTVTFSSSETETITSNGNSFNNVVFSIEGENAAWETTDALTVTGTQTVANDDGSSDMTPPIISNVGVSIRTDTGAVIVWSTDESASSRVVYGTASGVLSSGAGNDDTLNLQHVVLLSDLQPETTYFYRVVSTDLAGNTATGAQLTFTTLESGAGASSASSAAASSAGTDSSTPSQGGSGGGGGGGSRTRNICSLARGQAAFEVDDVEIAVDGTTAVVTWSTNGDGYSLVGYGIDSATDRAGMVLELTDEHRVTLTGLQPRQEYVLQAHSLDQCGALASSGEMSFVTGDGTATLGEDGASPDMVFERIINVMQQYASQLQIGEFTRLLSDHSRSLNELTQILPGPLLSGEPRVEASATTATISWQTNEESNGLVQFSPADLFGGGDYLHTLGNPERYDISHSVLLTGLTPGTTYHYRVRSQTPYGTRVTSNDFTFRTTQEAISILSYSVDVESTERATFRWRTNVDTTTQLRVTPYRNGVPNPDEQQAINEEALSATHAVTFDRFEAGVLYDVEIGGRDGAGNIVNQTIRRFSTNDEDLDPDISNVQTNTAIAPGKESKIQTVISWSTNEQTAGRVHYALGVVSDMEGSFQYATPLETSYAREHVVLLPSLEPGQIYSFQIESMDSSGNVARTRTYTILTPKEKEGVLQVILRQMEETFGWLGRLRGQ